MRLIVREGRKPNASEASENHLKLTQSAVSKAITELEHAFGVRLFDRTANGIEPTTYGRALLKGSAAVFDELRQSMNEIAHLSDPAMGELRIGCTPPMALGRCPCASIRGLHCTWSKRIPTRSATTCCPNARSIWRSAGSWGCAAADEGSRSAAP